MNILWKNVHHVLQGSTKETDRGDLITEKAEEIDVAGMSCTNLNAHLCHLKI